MQFTSYTFIISLIVCFIIYYIIPKKWQWVYLLIVSYIFYFSAGKVYPLFIFATSMVTYFTGIVLENKGKKHKAYVAEHRSEWTRDERKQYNAKAARKRRAYMLVGLLIALGILAVFKYTGFAIDNANSFLSFVGSDKQFEMVDLIVPMGISFYTFQSVGYLIDVYWEKIPAERNPFKFMLFVSFFPQLIQGPISRFSDLAASLYEKHSFDWKNVRFGLERILWGYFKKVVIADTIAVAVGTIKESPEYYTGGWVLVQILFWAINLYADFTGGIDITIGIAQVFGVKVTENFVRPFFSKSIAEFWRRWHITMGTWFRDYIFYPLSASHWLRTLTKKVQNKWGREAAKRVPIYIATLITWFATGIWHGAEWRYVYWGMLNGVVMLISSECEPLYAKLHAKFPRLKTTRGFAAVQVIRTCILMGFIRMTDCYSSVGETIGAFFGLFKNIANATVLSLDEYTALGLGLWQYGVVAAGVVVMIIVSLVQRKGSVREQISGLAYPIKFILFAALIIAILLVGTYGFGFDSNQFIYNKF